jgi:hypothetical protein
LLAESEPSSGDTVKTTVEAQKPKRRPLPLSLPREIALAAITAS